MSNYDINHANNENQPNRRITLQQSRLSEPERPNMEKQEEQEEQSQQQKLRLNQAVTSVANPSGRPSDRPSGRPSGRPSDRPSDRFGHLDPKSPKPPRPCELKGAGSIYHTMIYNAAPALDSRRNSATPLSGQQAAAEPGPEININGTAAAKNEAAGTGINGTEEATGTSASGVSRAMREASTTEAVMDTSAAEASKTTREEAMNTTTNGVSKTMSSAAMDTSASEEASQPAAKRLPRLSQNDLATLLAKLSARDLAVLEAIGKYRFLSSEQIGQLFMTESTSEASRSRIQRLLLQRLNQHGLITPLERRVGGSGGGSGVTIWHLTEPGQRLLMLNMPGEHPRKRYQKPSTLFLNHTMAIAECAVQIIRLARESRDIDLVQLDTEPDCWRKFESETEVTVLKPDMFVITNYDAYEDRWFIEMDLGTESLPEIIEKCDTYLRYYYSGIEQKETDMFPLVVWIVRTKERKESFERELSARYRMQPKMFLVIEPGELEKMLRMDIDVNRLNGGGADQDDTEAAGGTMT